MLLLGAMDLKEATMTSWILVANGSEARIYDRTVEHPKLKVVSEHHHPESRMKSAELIRSHIHKNAVNVWIKPEGGRSTDKNFMLQI